ncbi:uncharacterized protein LOC113343024 [Papaver somniferum]|uniref:uncharacterized protein LOC113343024 n=1 Tax=Papaver somniferum TaxID=3469 RepID=UPI000E702057|nr:uncharacterized protein LOC113343024 [Papaver somniferum]
MNWTFRFSVIYTHQIVQTLREKEKRKKLGLALGGRFNRGGKNMENVSGSSSKDKKVKLENLPVKKVPNLEGLHNRCIEKESMIQELKKDIESVKYRLEMGKHEVQTGNTEAILTLTKEYNRLRSEYPSLLNASGKSK